MSYLDWFDNGNLEPGFEVKPIRYSGPAYSSGSDRKFHHEMGYPYSIEQAEFEMLKIKNNPKALDYENVRRNQEST